MVYHLRPEVHHHPGPTCTEQRKVGVHEYGRTLTGLPWNRVRVRGVGEENCRTQGNQREFNLDPSVASLFEQHTYEESSAKINKIKWGKKNQNSKIPEFRVNDNVIKKRHLHLHCRLLSPRDLILKL